MWCDIISPVQLGDSACGRSRPVDPREYLVYIHTRVYPHAIFISYSQCNLILLCLWSLSVATQDMMECMFGSDRCEPGWTDPCYNITTYTYETLLTKSHIMWLYNGSRGERIHWWYIIELPSHSLTCISYLLRGGCTYLSAASLLVREGCACWPAVSPSVQDAWPYKRGQMFHHRTTWTNNLHCSIHTKVVSHYGYITWRYMRTHGTCPPRTREKRGNAEYHWRRDYRCIVT